MADIVTIAIPGAVIISVVSAFAGKYADSWIKRRRNGSHLISADEHSSICEKNMKPFVDRFERGEDRFYKIESLLEEIREKSNERHIEIIREMAALRR